MENQIYLFVRLVAAGYLIYKLFNLLFVKKLYGLWDKIPLRTVRSKPKPQPVVAAQTATDGVVGKSHIVYLEDPELAATVPTRSDTLERGDYIGEEEDVPDNEVEAELTSEQARAILSDDELYDLQGASGEPDPDFSSALTFNQIGNVVNVLTQGTSDDAAAMEAAQTIYQIRHTDMFLFLTSQISNTEMVDQLLSECLDGSGHPLPERKSRPKPPSVASFDMNKFV
ncbi:DUF4122 family protein [Bacteroides reticulotermitis]|uniref:DUF4122 family protein n=1 Tax=Bacteroides reticulotermitis TaxID=1133319 RepID=UPI003A891E1B